MNVEPISHVREWLTRMARMLPKSGDVGDLAARIDDMAKLMAPKVPPAMLNADSLEFCLRRIKFFPSYAELWGRLQSYQRDHKPKDAQKALPAPPGHEAMFATLDAAPLSTPDRVSARIWLCLALEGGAGEQELARRLGVERRYNPDAYRWLVANNEGAAQIAQRQDWAAADAPQEPVDPACFKALAGVLGQQVRQGLPGGGQETPAALPAPQPPDDVGSPASAALSATPHGVTAPPHRKPGQLTHAQLHAVRMANPELRKMLERQEAKRPLVAAPRAAKPVREPARAHMPWDDEGDDA